MRRILNLAAPTVLATFMACSNAADLAGKKDDKKDSRGAEGPAATSTSTSKSAAKSKKNAASGEDGSDESALTAGLPDECEAKEVAGRSCVVCVPRLLEVTECAAAGRSFDPEAACKNDGQSLSCDLGDGDKLSMDLTEETGLEKLYGSFDLILLGVEALLGGHLEKLPTAKEALHDSLDVLRANKDALFKCTDITPMVDQLADIAVKYAHVDASMTDSVKGMIKPALALFPSICKTVQSTQIGQLNGELMQALMGSFGALGGDLGGFANGLDQDALAGILAGLGGLGDLKDLFGQHGTTSTESSTSTSTEAATGTATSTATATSSASTTTTSTSTATATSTAP